MKKMVTIVLIFFILSCCEGEENAILLSNLNYLEIDDSGELLINRDYGFHLIENEKGIDSSFAMILIHGYGSLGKEWIQPIIELSSKSVQMYWYRWDWNQCPDEAQKQLLDSLLFFENNNAELDSLLIIGHSYGGLIAAMISEKWTGKIKLNIHSVAAPLAGISKVRILCDFEKEKYEVGPNTNLIQWITVQSHDNVFNEYKIDPQIVNLINGKVYRLSKVWDGKRLGHNRSILFITKQILKE